MTGANVSSRHAINSPSFGEDAQNNIYFVDYRGDVFGSRRRPFQPNQNDTLREFGGGRSRWQIVRFDRFCNYLRIFRDSTGAHHVTTKAIDRLPAILLFLLNKFFGQSR
jgi:hypothetical protein